ncbi:hypothetical protein Ancab_014725 [Ancistrocladus abbreviatus]
MAAKATTCPYFPSIAIFFLIPLSSFTVAKSQNSLTRDSSLSVEDAADVLTSPDDAFSCGLYSVRGANARTVVWMANRDNPVNGHGSRLMLRHDGALVLTDAGGSIAWQSNTTNTNANTTELLDSGNLVIKDPNGNILWQSFDYPTDALLPNQPFTNSKRLTSGIGKHMFASGYFNLYFDSLNVLSLIYDGPEISSLYWPRPDFSIYQNGRTNYSSSRVALFDDVGRFLSSDGLKFSASDMGPGIKRRLTMDHDGNLRLYSLNHSAGVWIVTWEALQQLCSVHGICGRNGICINTPQPKCSCPPLYKPIDSTDLSKGCKPKFGRSHSDSQFVELPHTDYYGFDLNYTRYDKPSTFEECRQLYLGDYRCQAFSYRLNGEGLCWTKGALFNGYQSPAFPGSLYLRLPTRFPVILNVLELACGSNESKTIIHSSYYVPIQRAKWVYLYSFASAIGTLEVLFLALGWGFFLRKNGVPSALEDGYYVVASQFRSFNYGELKIATIKFKEVLGRGGFGIVYKGILADDRVVAVKRLGDVMLQGDEEFWAEVSIIGKINHMNLVRMWGFCSEGKHWLLVYEYIENSFLTWKDRFKVAAGTARGLAYLHHECLEWVIHCDVKPENILLDSNFEPKISDFGLAKLSQRGRV